ncbi:hypothetical protein [Promicromonospora soli]
MPRKMPERGAIAPVVGVHLDDERLDQHHVLGAREELNPSQR